MPVQPASSSTFVIPLVFDTSTFVVNVGKVAIFEQWVLVVATAQEGSKVHLDVFYNRPSKKTPKGSRIDELEDVQIRTAARSVVTNSGWLAKTPVFEDKLETWHPVCESIGKKLKIGGMWSSAHLVVLTAWAYMLGLPIPSQMKPGPKQDDKIYLGIQRLVAMALDGRLTPDVIDLFIKLHFVAPQPIKDAARKVKLSPAQRSDAGAYMMNKQALDTALKKLQKDPKVFSRSSIRGGGPGPTGEPPYPVLPQLLARDVNPTRLHRNRDKTYWQTTFLNWMRAHARAIRSCVGRYRNSHWAVPQIEMNDDQVFGAIGALWCGRWQSAKARRVGFGAAHVMHWLRAQEETTDGANRVIGGSKRTSPRGRMLPLMMPLCGLPDEEFHVGTGHWVLVVARQIAEGRRRRRVKLYLWNSVQSGVQNAGIERQARQLIRRSGYLGRDGEGKPLGIEPVWDPLEVMACPEQRFLNSCGVYVVLNAWCFQLGLTSPPRRLFSNSLEQDEAFVRCAILMINLARCGEMDSYGIRAFLLASGYGHPSEMKSRQGGDNVACIEVGDICQMLLEVIDAIVDEERSDAERQFRANQPAT